VKVKSKLKVTLKLAHVKSSQFLKESQLIRLLVNVSSLSACTFLHKSQDYTEN